MRKSLLAVATPAALLTAAATTAIGQPIEETNLRIPLIPAGLTNLNRFSFSYRMGFNYSVSFRGLGGYSLGNSGPGGQRTPSGDPYNYDNGYIYPDQTTASAHPGYTWYYGYQAGTPMNSAGTQFSLYKNTASANASETQDQNGPTEGFELNYDRQLGHIGPIWWGVEAAFGYNHVDIHDDRPLVENLTRTTDTFQTGGGAVLNPAPFQGTVTGPGEGDANGWPLVGLTPVSSSSQSVSDAASITGSRELDAQIFTFRLGPYIDLPLTHRFMATFSGGLLILDVVSQFTFNETVSINPAYSLVTLPGESHQGSVNSNDILLGVYASGNISYALSDHVRLVAGAQLESTDNFTQSVAGKSAVLNLEKAVLVTLGLSYSF